MKKSPIFQLLFVVLFFATMAFTFESHADSRWIRPSSEPIGQDTKPGSKMTTITGTVSIFEEKTFILTSETDYDVVGYDFKNLVNTMVRVTGTLTENQYGYLIHVKLVEKVKALE
jgi:hypothetical protein